MSRKAIPVRVQVSVAIRQASDIPAFVWCALCDGLMDKDEPRTLEHLVPHADRIALGLDPDAEDNLAWCHKACSDKKTDGPSHLKVAGDKSKIARSKRLQEAREVHEAVLARVAVRPPGSIKSRPFAKGKRRFR